MARILDRLVLAHGEQAKTRLQRACNLNYDTLLSYLAWLEARGLVEVAHKEDGTETVQLTARGAAACAKLADWIRDFVERQSRSPP